MRILFFYILLCFSFPSIAQIEQVESQPADTTSVIQKPNITDLPIRAASSRIRALQIERDTLVDSEVENLVVQSDSLFRNTANFFLAYDTASVKIKSIRILENKRMLFQSEKDKIDRFLDNVNRTVVDITSNAEFLQKEILFWREVRKDSTTAFLQQALNLDSLEMQLNASNRMAQGRMQKLLNVLNKGTQLSIYCDKLIVKVDKQRDDLKNLLITGYYPPLYRLISQEGDWQVGYYLKQYISDEKYELINYFKIRKDKLVFIVLLFLAVLSLIIYYRKPLMVNIGQQTCFREKIALAAVKMPISTAILIALFWGVIFLDNRPFAVRDFLTFALLLPILNVMFRCLPRRFRGFTFLIIVITFLHMIFVVLPATNYLFRVNLFIALALQFVASILQIRYSKAMFYIQSKALRIAHRLGYIYLMLTAVGLIANLVGQVYLAQIIELSVFLSLGTGVWMFFLVNLFQMLTIRLLDSEKAKSVNYLRKNRESLRKKILNLVAITGFLFWLTTFLLQLHLFENVKSVIGYFFQEKYTIGSFQFSLGTLFLFILIIYLSALLSRFVKEVVEDDILNKANLPKGVPYTIAVITRYTIISIGVLLAISVAGIDMSSLTIIIGAFSVGIGFGLQNIFNNLVSGLILLFERPVQIGDTIEIGDLIGTVKSIGIRSSNIATIDGAEVVVPNGNLISNELINWTLSNQRRRIEIFAGVAYSSNPHQVKELLTKVIHNNREVMDWPAPTVLFNEMGDSSLNFRVLVWVGSYDNWVRIKSELTFEIFDILGEHGIEIPFPQRDIHIKTENKDNNSIEE